MGRVLIKNSLPKDHPYFESKTEKQWKLLKRVINTDAVGETMYFNGHRQQSGKFYRLEETRLATEEELEVWRAERREKDKKKREQKKAKEERERREKEERLERKNARKKRLLEMEKSKILCLDVETTGLYPAFDEILQLSIIDGNGEVLFNQYICPKEHTEWEEAEQVNGISPLTVAGESTIDGYIPVLEQILSKAELLVGYNILKFDLWFLHCAGVNLPEEVEVFDVMLEFAPIFGEWNSYHRDYTWQKLSNCARYYNYPDNEEKYHNSLFDVRATLHCFYAMLQDENL